MPLRPIERRIRQLQQPRQRHPAARRRHPDTHRAVAPLAFQLELSNPLANLLRNLPRRVERHMRKQSRELVATNPRAARPLDLSDLLLHLFRDRLQPGARTYR